MNINIEGIIIGKVGWLKIKEKKKHLLFRMDNSVEKLLRLTI